VTVRAEGRGGPAVRRETRAAEFRRVMRFLDEQGVRIVRGYGRDEDSLPFEGHTIRRLGEQYAEEAA